MFDALFIAALLVLGFFVWVMYLLVKSHKPRNRDEEKQAIKF